MVELVLLRHGQSIWNRDNLFTGWSDVDLSDAGLEEAHRAARLLRSHGIIPEWGFTSLLKRAIRTLWIVIDELDRMWLPVEKDWRLNERHYGALQGKHKGKTAEEVGEDVVHTWRRSYAVRPPPVDTDDERFPGHDPRYSGIPWEVLPRAESLRDTVARVLPYWHEAIAPRLRQGRVVLIAAHGNSLRALVKHLDDRSDDDIAGVEIPTGVPLVYMLDADLRPIESRYLHAM